MPRPASNTPDSIRRRRLEQERDEKGLCRICEQPKPEEWEGKPWTKNVCPSCNKRRNEYHRTHRQNKRAKAQVADRLARTQAREQKLQQQALTLSISDELRDDLLSYRSFLQERLRMVSYSEPPEITALKDRLAALEAEVLELLQEIEIKEKEAAEKAGLPKIQAKLHHVEELLKD